MSPTTVLRVFAASILAVATLSGCGPSAQEDPVALAQGLTQDTPGPLFFALSQRPNAVMEALFQGRVSLDDAGCLRFDSSEPATVIWPFRSSLEDSDGVLRVLDEAGDEIGRIGGEFRLGGGFVQTLHDGIPLSDSDQALATDRCPGVYWIVGAVL
ncbi:MAG TPA: hypothetical protein VE173_11205 [Longimicrobiales bacterium]|nr:hypothetical protein [Longimicrobiales bacterium]